MRSFAILSILLTSLSIGLAQASFSELCTSEICGEPVSPVELPAFRRGVGTTTTTARRRHFTNAERLSRGLPPMPPVRRADSCGTAGPQASALPQTTYEGTIQVKSLVDSIPTTVLGYLSSTSAGNGLFTTTASLDSALKVSFNLNTGATTGSNVALTMVNSAGPLLGLVQGRDSTSSDISSTSFNYLYLNGIGLPGSGAGCPPTTLSTNYTPSPNRAAESSIWYIDLTTGVLTPQWVNSDLSTPMTYMWMQSSVVYGGGSQAQFQTRYPAPTTAVALFFVPTI